MIAEKFEKELQELVHPLMDDFVTYNVYRYGNVCIREHTLKELWEMRTELEMRLQPVPLHRGLIKKLKYYGFLVEELKNQNKYNEAISLYHQSEQKIIERFKEAVFEDYGVTSSPKSEFVWQTCWDLGHAGGLSEVESYFSVWSKVILL